MTKQKGLLSDEKNLRIYGSWYGMMQRCLNKKCKDWRYYGKIGIGVSENWKTFENFLNDMKETYFPTASIDRIDNSLGYSKENCRWATRKMQANNRDFCHILEYEGERLNIMQWANKLGIYHMTIRNRLKRGWSVEDTIKIPVRELSKK